VPSFLVVGFHLNPAIPLLLLFCLFSSNLHPPHVSLTNITFLSLDNHPNSTLGATPSPPRDAVGPTSSKVDPGFKVGPARENLSPIRCPYVIRSESIWGFRPKDSITIFVLEKLCMTVEIFFSFHSLGAGIYYYQLKREELQTASGTTREKIF
jgi:hypothetical protein